MPKNLFKYSGMTLALAAVAALTGCASIVSGTNQILSVETMQKDGTKVAGATCKLENDKGVYYVTTPGTVNVHRAYGDLNVKCQKAELADGVSVVKSSTKGMAAGNILFGGVVGIGVDAATGAAYDYPNLLQVMMGDKVESTVAASTTPVAPVAAATTGAVQ